CRRRSRRCRRSPPSRPWRALRTVPSRQRLHTAVVTDSNPPGVAFVAHCLLNQNSKTDGGARCPGVYSPLVDELRERGWRIEQMPCPELAFTGLNRFWAVREQYDTTAFRRHCRKIAAAVAGAIEVHVARGDDVILVGIDGSPSMGVHVTRSDPARGGRPEWPDGAPELSPGSG